MSLIGSTTVREARCNEIDTAIKKLLEQVLTLKTQRNELALISCLPAEIMAKIFLFVRAEYFDRVNGLQWITISHVSTHWRNIAMNSAVLWTRLPFGNNCCTAEMIKRSKGANLSIHFNFLYNRSRLNLNKTFPLLERALACDGCIRELDLLNIPLSQQALVNALPPDLPHLERLHMSGQYTSIDNDGSLLVVPGSILSRTGKLRNLTISDCRMDWISYLPSSITDLDLCAVRTISDSTILQLIATLENMPALEVLELENSLPARGRQERGSRHVRLQKLRKLSINSSLAQAAIFFSHITFPPTARVFIITHEDESELQMTSDITEYRTSLLASIIKSYSDCPSDFTFRSLTLDTDGSSWDGGIVITLYMPDGQNNPYSSALLSLTLDSALFIDPTVHTRVLHEMFDSELYLEDISFLSLKRGFSPQALAQTVGMLPNISRIRASGYTNAAKDLIEALQLPPSHSSEVFCFANLSTLELCNVIFSDTSQEPHILSLSKLQDCLIWRYEGGVEIAKLCLEECEGENLHHDVELLEQIVVNVDWDGLGTEQDL